MSFRMLQYFEGVPDFFADAEKDDFEILKTLKKPTLIRLKGKSSGEALFVSCLIHGDEESGWKAVRAFLGQPTACAWDLYFSIGNIPAALWGKGHEQRVVPPDGEDYNRCWDIEQATGPLAKSARELLDFLKTKKLRGSLDIHNTTGRNPPFCVIADSNEALLTLASQFSDRIIHSPLNGTLTRAMGDLCPSLTVECGIRGEKSSEEVAKKSLKRFLEIFGAPTRPTLERKEYRLFKDPERVLIPKEISIGVEGESSEPRDFMIARGLDRFNFNRVPPGTLLGTLRSPERELPFRHKNPNSPLPTNSRLIDTYFRKEGNRVVSKAPFTPIMMSLSERAIHLDCFFYLGESPLGE